MNGQEHQIARNMIHAALDELNEQSPPETRIPPGQLTTLVGPDGYLDSLGVVTLVALLEERLEREAGVVANLLETPNEEQDALAHFATVDALVDRVVAAMAEGAHA